jgi:DNA-binding transcriptional LysR family regulator
MYMSDYKQAWSLATVDLRPAGGHRTITAAKVVPMTWNSLDLNLLRVFNAIMQERTLTRAGQRLGMSQPAMSHALARLRHMLKDDLFVRTPDGMCPTPRAERMEAPLRAALQELRVTLEDDEFDAAQATRNFVIVANNHAARAVVPALTRRVAKLAPSVVLDVRPMGMQHVLDQLDGGSVELALTTLAEGGDRFKCVGLLEDEYVVMLPSTHPLAVEPELSIEHFATLPQIVSTSGGDDSSAIDDALAKYGLARHVAARVPLHSLIFLLIDSNSIAVVPRRVASALVAIGPLIMRPLPFPSPRVSLSMIWHRRLDNHPAHRWLRGTMRAAVMEA